MKIFMRFTKIIFLLVSLCFFISFLGIDVYSAQKGVKDISWDKDKRTLNYTLLADSTVKIRVGSMQGGVYRTLLNLEERTAGQNSEPWDGKDEQGIIDFLEYEPLHFCVDVLPPDKKDCRLSIKINSISNKKKTLDNISLERGMLKPDERGLNLTLDVEQEIRPEFSKGKIEIMAFWDNALIKLARVDRLPQTVNLDLKNYPGGRHLLTLNVWSADHALVAYKNLFVLLEGNEENVEISAANKEKMSLLGKMTYGQRHKGFWQVWTANLDGTEPRPLTEDLEDKRYPAFSPDGKEIAYVTTDGNLWIMDSNGNNPRKIPLSLHVSYPRWSPDSQKIIFVSYQDLYHGDSEIWEVDLGSLKLKKIISRPWMQYDAGYSPDGKDIVFTDGPELYAQEIIKLNLETGDVTQLTDNGPYDYDMQPVYSPDGKLIVYSSRESGNYDIWAMDRFGQGKKNLFPNPAHDYMPQISADGKYIFFLSDQSNIMEVWRIDINGNNLIPITKDNKDKQDLNVYTRN